MSLIGARALLKTLQTTPGLDYAIDDDHVAVCCDDESLLTPELQEQLQEHESDLIEIVWEAVDEENS